MEEIANENKVVTSRFAYSIILDAAIACTGCNTLVSRLWWINHYHHHHNPDGYHAACPNGNAKPNALTDSNYAGCCYEGEYG